MKEKEGIIMKRIRRQLILHWAWLKHKKPSEVADFVDTAMRQALSKKNPQEGRRVGEEKE